MADDAQEKYARATQYIRAKVNQLLELLGTLPLRPEELDDDTLFELDPIGIVADSFGQVLANLHDTNHALHVARSEIRTVFDAMSAAVVVLNREGNVQDCNRQAREWFFHGAEYDAVIGRSLNDVCACGGALETELKEAPRHSDEFTFGGRHFHVIRSSVINEQGTPERTVFLYFDITRQKATEESLRLYARVFDNTAEGVAITDSNGTFLRINDAFCRITGYSERELLGDTPRLLRSGRHDEDFYRQMRQQLERNGHWQGEIFDRHRDGGIIPLLQTISAVRDDEGAITHYISIITDITSLKETQTRLDFLAHHDVLTELPNRLLFNARLEHTIERARRDDKLFGLLFIDLDRFKTINDSLGHQFGDRFLIAVAKRLKTLVRKADTVARLGGDEFVVLLENLRSPHEATNLATKVVNAMKLPFIIGDTELHMGCSIGITLYPEDGTDAVTLLKNADAAMYQVKEAGRDGYRKFSPELSAAAHEKLTLENALRAAIRERQLLLYYQPIIDLEQQRIIAAEALVRWPHPERGMISPEVFIPLAEESKLILPLGAWVAQQAVRQLAVWHSAGLALDYISINASGAQIYHPGFADDLFDLLHRHDIGAAHLQVELTENVLLRDIESCRHVLLRMREHGVRVAIDDFGTGYSSLAYLKQLPIDDLKIDRSFVRDIPQDPSDCAIAQAIIGMAHTLGLETVAEGVETVEQERFLTEMGCNKVQGFYYSKPMPAEAFYAYFRSFNPLPHTVSRR